MKIRYMSDVHNEFSVLDVPVQENESEQVLVLAGDIGVAYKTTLQHTIVDFVESLASRFKAVIYVLGNHEHYKCIFHSTLPRIKESFENLDNVHVLNNEFVIIDDVVFVGSTLWTSLKDGDPLVMNCAKQYMNDYISIRYEKMGTYSKLYPEVTVSEHYYSRDYIFHIASEHRDKKVVVVSHHAPSYESVHEMYRGRPNAMVMNYNYFSDLDYHILDNDNIALWLHGHTHTNFDYMIGDTRVVCNPRGYQREGDIDSENLNFDPYLYVDIGE